MNIKITHPPPYWDADRARTIIELLDVLRDQLLEIYGDKIAEKSAQDEHQGQLDFDHNIDF